MGAYMDFDLGVYNFTKRELRVRQEALDGCVSAGDVEGAVEWLRVILELINKIPLKNFAYRDMREYAISFYRDCIRRVFSLGVPLDERYYVVRGESIK